VKREIQFHIVITAHINLKERVLLYITTEIYNLILDTQNIPFYLLLSPVYVYARKKKRKKKRTHNIQEFPILILTMSDN